MAIVILGFGYVGAALARQLRSTGERVVALDDFFSTPPSLAWAAAASAGVELEFGSILESADVDRALDVPNLSAVYLLAAQPSADPAAATPDLTERVNLTGPRLVFEACARRGVPHLVFGSSMRVYGRNPAGLVTEQRAYGVAPDLPHLGKTYAEQLFVMLSATSPVAVTSVRLGLVYGVGPIMKTDSRFMTAPNRFCQAVARGEPMVLRPGTRRPDQLVHVEDAAAGLAFLASHAPAAGHVSVNLAGETSSIRDVALMIGALADERGRPARLADGSGEFADESVDVRSRLTELGWLPRRSLREGLAETLDYFLKRAP